MPKRVRSADMKGFTDRLEVTCCTIVPDGQIPGDDTNNLLLVGQTEFKELDVLHALTG